MRRLANMVSDDEKRRVAAELREYASWGDEDDDCLVDFQEWGEVVLNLLDCGDTEGECYRAIADLIDPDTTTDTTKSPGLTTKCDRDAEYEAWYNSLSHYGSAQGEPSNIRELIEEIVWAALTVDLGPNGNTDPSTGIDEGGVYTNNMFAEWEREALRLSGGVDRDVLLRIADEMADDAGSFSRSARLAVDEGDRKMAVLFASIADDYIERANRIRSALGVSRGDQQKA